MIAQPVSDVPAFLMTIPLQTHVIRGLNKDDKRLQARNGEASLMVSKDFLEKNRKKKGVERGAAPAAGPIGVRLMVAAAYGLTGTFFIVNCLKRPCGAFRAPHDGDARL